MNPMGMWRGLAAALVIGFSGAMATAADQPASGVKAASAASATTPAGSATAPAAKVVVPPRAAPPVVTNPHQMRNLFGPPAKPRFELRDIDWPAKTGEASLCLWKDDAIAAASMGIDDNCAYNLPWWMDMCKKYGLRPTWWLVTGEIGKRGNSGTWEAWQKVLAAGCDVQSHTVNHLSTKSPTWTGNMDDEYRDSQKAINENVPGARCMILAYPGGPGQEANDPAIAARYYIAARGGFPFINQANAIDYMQVRGTSAFTIDEGKFPEQNLVTALDKSPKNKSWRGWWVGFFHWIKTDDAAATASCEKRFAYIQGKVQSGDLWLGLFREVAQYGQERDTARLEVKSVAADKIVLNLTDDMDDTLFDFPLTVKVRLDPAWKSAKAMQGAKETGCKIVEHEGAKFALLQIVPDRGEVVLVPGQGK